MKNKETKNYDDRIMKIFEKFGYKMVEGHKRGAVVIIGGKPIEFDNEERVCIKPLTKEEIDKMTDDEKIERALEIAKCYPDTNLPSDVTTAKEDGNMSHIDKLLMKPSMTLLEARNLSYAMETD